MEGDVRDKRLGRSSSRLSGGKAAPVSGRLLLVVSEHLELPAEPLPLGRVPPELQAELWPTESPTDEYSLSPAPNEFDQPWAEPLAERAMIGWMFRSPGGGLAELCRVGRGRGLVWLVLAALRFGQRRLNRLSVVNGQKVQSADGSFQVRVSARDALVIHGDFKWVRFEPTARPGQEVDLGVINVKRQTRAVPTANQ